jgi:hypothetical protein
LSEEESKYAKQLSAFKNRREETERVKQLACSEREAARSLRSSLTDIARARGHCDSSLLNGSGGDDDDDDDHHHGNAGAETSRLNVLRESVVEAEAAANESDQKVADTVKRMEELKEEANACAEKIPQLEAAKKVRSPTISLSIHRLLYWHHAISHAKDI